MVLLDTSSPTNGQGSKVLALVQPPSISEGPEGPKPSDPPRRGPGRPRKNEAPAKAKAAPAAKAPTKKVAAKPAKKKKATRTAARAVAATERATKAAADGDVAADVHLAKIQKAFGRYNRAMTARTQTGKTCGEQLKAAEAAFSNAIEAPLDTAKVETDAYRVKLENVEMRWQELSETKAGNIEERKHATEKVKEARENLARVIENSAQLDMFQDE